MSKLPLRPSAVHVLRNQQGLIIADFVFSISLASGLGILLFSISYALAVVEVTQYISFSVARAHLAGNKSPEEQQAKAEAKYRQLGSGNRAIGALYKNAWFTLGSADKLDIRSGETGNGKTFSEDLGAGQDLRKWFIGVSFPLTLGILKLRLPLIGDTAPDADQGLQTRLNTMLIRDPSEKECKDFMEERRQALRNLPSGQQFYDPAAYIPMEDNGC